MEKILFKLITQWKYLVLNSEKIKRNGLMIIVRNIDIK